MRTSNESSANITGFMGGINGRLIIIINNSRTNQKFIQESSNSLVSNRFVLGTSNVTIDNGQTILFLYTMNITVGTTPGQNRWVMLSNT